MGKTPRWRRSKNLGATTQKSKSSMAGNGEESIEEGGSDTRPLVEGK